MVTQIDVANKNQIKEVNEDKLLNFITSAQDTIQIYNISKIDGRIYNYIFSKEQYNRDNIIIWEKHQEYGPIQDTSCWEKKCQGFYNSKQDILYLWLQSFMYYYGELNQRKKIIDIDNYEIEIQQKIAELLLNKIKNEYKTQPQLTERDLLNKLNGINEYDEENKDKQLYVFYERTIEYFKRCANDIIADSEKTKYDLLECRKECTLDIFYIFSPSDKLNFNFSLKDIIEFTDNQNEYLEKFVNSDFGRFIKQKIEYAYLENELINREIIKLYNSENFCKRRKILDEIRNTKTIRITIKAKNNKIYQFQETTESFAYHLQDYRQRYPYYDENSRQSIEYSFDDILLIEHGTKTLYQSKQHPAT